MVLLAQAANAGYSYYSYSYYNYYGGYHNHYNSNGDVTYFGRAFSYADGCGDRALDSMYSMCELGDVSECKFGCAIK